MKRVTRLFVFMAFAMVAHVDVQAENLDTKRFYVGGGLNFNSLPGVGSARGFQFIGGYEFKFKLNDDISSALELGYMDSGDFDRINASGNSEDVTGAWVSMLESAPLSRKTDMLVRLGYDFGDDDGLLLGAGMQYRFDTKLVLRMEYVAREHVTGLQANVLIKF